MKINYHKTLEDEIKQWLAQSSIRHRDYMFGDDRVQRQANAEMGLIAFNGSSRLYVEFKRQEDAALFKLFWHDRIEDENARIMAGYHSGFMVNYMNLQNLVAVSNTNIQAIKSII